MKEKIFGNLKKCIMVNPLLLLVFILISTLSLIYVFHYKMDESAFAYIAYVFSFYTLSVSVFRLTLFIKKMDIKKKKKALADRNMVAKRFFDDGRFHFFLLFSLSIPLNIGYAILKTVYGFVLHSNWIVQNGVYYALLTLMRFIIIRGAEKNEEDKALKLSSIILSISSFHYLLMVLEMYLHASSPHYPGYIVYGASLYAFIKVGVAIKGCIKLKTTATPAIVAGNNLKISHAFVSLIFLESGMLNIFGEGTEEERLILLISGLVVVAYLFVSGPLLIVWNKRNKV